MTLCTYCLKDVLDHSEGELHNCLKKTSIILKIYENMFERQLDELQRLHAKLLMSVTNV